MYTRYIISFILGGLFAMSSVAFFITWGLGSWLAGFVALCCLFCFYLVIDGEYRNED